MIFKKCLILCITLLIQFRIMKKLFILSIILIFTACTTNTSSDNAKDSTLGELFLEVTGESEALPSFKTGLLLLHSFEYKDAREAFEEAQLIDSSMAMAYWGEAMTYNHNLWGQQDFEKGVSVLEKMKMLNQFTGLTDLESDLIKSIEILYAADKEKLLRDQEYADFMKTLYEKYAGNHEVASFYALSLLGSVPDGRDVEIYEKGAEIVKKILEENPKHPGALHYLIHSYDDPGHAKFALDAAHEYAIVAPDASHALHMPSHIYVALGMWDEVVASNEHSYQASVDRMKRKDLDNNARGYHAYHWLEYGYLQQGKVDTAAQMVREIARLSEASPSKRSRAHVVLLKGTYLVETNDWDSDIAEIEVDISDLNISLRSQYRFLEGMKALKIGAISVMDSIVEGMNKDYELTAFNLTEDGAKMCAGADRTVATQSDLDKTKTMVYQLMGSKFWKQGDQLLAEQWLQKAVETETAMSYSYGPPVIKQPSHELYAEWLIEQGRYKEALESLDKTLERATLRTSTLIKKKDLAAKMGNQNLVNELDQLIKSIQS